MSYQDLEAFVHARLDEDAAKAEAGFSHPDRWVHASTVGIPNGLSCSAVLADVDAKQKLLAYLDSYGGPETEDAYHAVLQHLALPYNEHPTYDEEWRP